MLPLVGQPAIAETVYMCNGEGEGGSTLFSDKPCRSGQGQTLHFPDVYTTGEGLSELERQQLEEIQARESEQGRETVKLTPEEEETPASPQKATVNKSEFDPQACRNAEEGLKQWNRIMSLGYLPEQKETMEAEQQKRINNRNRLCNSG